MLCSRQGFIRMTSVAAMSASCLAAVGCSATSTPDPLAGVSAAKIQTMADDNFNAASTLTWSGTKTVQGTAESSTVGYRRGKACSGTVRYSSENGKENLGSYKFIQIFYGHVYLSPDVTYWDRNVGAAKAGQFPLISGKYLQLPPGTGAGDDITELCDLTDFMAPLNDPGAATKGAVTTLGGIRVVPIKDHADGVSTTEYVTDSSKPEVVQLTWSISNQGVSATYTLSIGAPVTLAAPPPGQVMDASKLGL